MVLTAKLHRMLADDLQQIALCGVGFAGKSVTQTAAGLQVVLEREDRIFIRYLQLAGRLGESQRSDVERSKDLRFLKPVEAHSQAQHGVGASVPTAFGQRRRCAA